MEHEELCEELRKLKNLDVAYYIYKVGGDEIEDNEGGDGGDATDKGIEDGGNGGEGTRHHSIYHRHEHYAKAKEWQDGITECRGKEIAGDTEQNGMGSKGEERHHSQINRKGDYAEAQSHPLAIAEGVEPFGEPRMT